ncbi:MAG: hypothetical protein LBH48_04655 [Bifidobacteriaceae bacterium]|jgi:hypothetical protein|nr:hypothetical protein [Bifidobacteriaceae bacterium]
MTATYAKPAATTVGRLAAVLTASVVCAVGALCTAPPACAADDPIPAAPSAAAKALGLQRPGISGALVKGAKVEAVPGAVPKGSAVSYQWLRNGKAIKGAKHKTYKIIPADAAKRLAVRVRVKASGQSAVTQTSVARTVPKVGKAVKAAKVSISGKAAVGATLKAMAEAWSPKDTKLSYQWTRDGWNIAGATKASYKVNAKDAGAKIGLVVVGKAKARGSAIAVASAKSVPAPTSPVQAPPAATPPANQPPPPPATDKPAPDAAPPTKPAPPAPPTSDPSDDPKPPPATTDKPTQPDPAPPTKPAPPAPDPSDHPKPPPPAATDKPAPDPAPPTKPAPPAPPAPDPSDDPKPSPPPSESPSPLPTDPEPVDPIEVPTIAITESVPFTVSKAEDITQAELAKLKFDIPVWKDAEGNTVPGLENEDLVTFTLTSEDGKTYFESPTAFTVLHMTDHGFMTYTMPTPTTSPTTSQSPEPGNTTTKPPDPPEASGWSFAPGAAFVGENGVHIDYLRTLTSGKYTVTLIVTKAGSKDIPEYVPHVVTWPLQWTNQKPNPKTVARATGTPESFTIPTPTVMKTRHAGSGVIGWLEHEAEDFYGISVDFPIWADMFEHAVSVLAADTLTSVAMYKPGEYEDYIAKHEAWVKAGSKNDGSEPIATPTPVAHAAVPGADTGANTISVLASEADGYVMQDSDGYKLLPIKFLLNYPVGNPALAVTGPAYWNGVTALDKLESGTYTIMAEFMKESDKYGKLVVTWHLNWTGPPPMCTGWNVFHEQCSVDPPSR